VLLRREAIFENPVAAASEHRCFDYALPPDRTDDGWTAQTALIDAVRATGRAFLSSTACGGRGHAVLFRKANDDATSRNHRLLRDAGR